jgi:uncharacterized protein YlaI
VFTTNEINNFADIIKSHQIKKTNINDIFYTSCNGTDEIEIDIKIPPFLSDDLTKSLNEIDFRTFFANRLNNNHICGTYYICDCMHITGIRTETDGSQSYYIKGSGGVKRQAFGIFAYGGETFYTYIEGSYDGCATCGMYFGGDPNYKLQYINTIRRPNKIFIDRKTI